MCMMDLACSGELESMAGKSQGWGGGARIRVVGNGHQCYIARHYLECDNKVSFCSRLKALVDNLL